MFKYTIIVVHILAINNVLWTNATENNLGNIDEDVIVKLLDRVDKLEAREEGHLREIEALRDEVKQLKARVGTSKPGLVWESVNAILWTNATENKIGNIDEDVIVKLLNRVDKLEAREEGHLREIEALRDEVKQLKDRVGTSKPGLVWESVNAILWTNATENKIGNIDEDVIVKLLDRVDKLEAREEDHLREIEALRDEVAVLKGQVEPKIRRRRQDVADNVAFYAVVDTHHIRNLGANQRIEFDRVVTNIGGGYLPGLGVFITPVGGTYVFTTTLMGVNHNNVQYYISMNGNAVGNLYIHGEDSYLDSASRTVVLYLNKGDEISVNNSNVTEGVFGYQFSSFAGFLLRPDVSISDIVG